MDKTLIHHFTLESNWQSAEWTAAGKVLASIFWEVQGILFDYLEKGRTINSEYYLALLVYLKEEVKKRPQM